MQGAVFYNTEKLKPIIPLQKGLYFRHPLTSEGRNPAETKAT